MDWSSTSLVSIAPTNASPAPVVSTCLTLNASTAPWKSYGTRISDTPIKIFSKLFQFDSISVTLV